MLSFNFCTEPVARGYSVNASNESNQRIDWVEIGIK